MAVAIAVWSQHRCFYIAQSMSTHLSIHMSVHIRVHIFIYMPTYRPIHIHVNMHRHRSKLISQHMVYARMGILPESHTVMAYAVMA